MRLVLGGVLALLRTASELRADPLDRWSWLYLRPQGSSFNAVTYGDGLFVAVGDWGAIVTSGDAYHWTNQSYGTFPNLLGVGYSAGTYAAVGVGGVILTSSNCINWTQRSSPTTNTLRGIAGNPVYHANNQFLAVGDRGTIVFANDVATWADGSSPDLTTSNLRGITFVDGDVTMVGDNGTFLTFWQHPAPPPPSTTNSINAFVAGNGVYAIGGDLGTYTPPGTTTNVIFYSTNSAYWNRQLFTGSFGATDGLWYPSDLFAIRGMAFGNSRFVAVGDTGKTLERNYPGVLLVSDTGTNWTELGALTSENYLYGVTYGNGRFVAVGAAGSILVSSNGLDWSELTGYHRTAVTAIACNEDLCIASGQGVPRVYSWLRFPDFSTLVSSNGNDWVVATTNLPAMSDLFGSGNLFVGVSGGCIYATSNSFIWTTNCISPTTLHGVGYEKGLFLVVGDSGAIFTSPDGQTWSDHSIANAGNFNCAAYGNGLFVAAGTSVATSTDGTSWSLFATNPPANIARVVYANRMFVAAGYVASFYLTARFLSSQDGKNWQVRYTSPATAFPTYPTVAYASGTFLGLLGQTLFKSPDGIAWSSGATSLPLNASDLVFSYPYGYSPPLCARRGTFIAGGMDGILMQSADTRVPIISNSARLTDLGFTFTFNPQIGDPYRVQASTNLEFWENLQTELATNQLTTFTDASAPTLSKRFFRVVSP